MLSKLQNNIKDDKWASVKFFAIIKHAYIVLIIFFIILIKLESKLKCKVNFFEIRIFM